MYSTAAPEGRGSISAGVSSVTRPAYERGRDLAARLEMGAVAARDDEPLHGAPHLCLDPVELVERAVRIVGTLDQQHRAADALGLVLQAPVAEGGIEPDVAPAVERGVRIVVVAGHALAQLPVVVGRAGLADGGHRDLLDDDVRREQRDAGHGVVGSVDERDRAAVAVADEDGLADVELREHLGEDLERLLVEERGRPWAGRRVGAPVPEAGERDYAPARRRVQRPREAAPEPDRPQPLVEEDEGAPVLVAGQLDRFEPAPRDGERPLDGGGGHRGRAPRPGVSSERPAPPSWRRRRSRAASRGSRRGSCAWPAP